MKHARRALWALNGLLCIGTIAVLALPRTSDGLRDVDPAAALPSPPPKPGERPNEEVLLILRNPLQAREEPIRRPDPTMALHGALPTREGVRGVAFIRTAQNVNLVVPIGEEIQGWRLDELWRDQATFTNSRGERKLLQIAR